MGVWLAGDGDLCVCPVLLLVSRSGGTVALTRDYRDQFPSSRASTVSKL